MTAKSVPMRPQDLRPGARASTCTLSLTPLAKKVLDEISEHNISARLQY